MKPTLYNMQGGDELVELRRHGGGLAGLLATWWPEGDEADALHLTDVVEADDADIGVRVLLLHLLHLIDDLRGVGAAEHGQLPHCPVPAVVVPGRVAVLAEDEADLAELEAGNPLGLDQEVDLLQELLHGERWQVRQGLELLDALNRPHLNIYIMECTSHQLVPSELDIHKKCRPLSTKFVLTQYKMSDTFYRSEGVFKNQLFKSDVDVVR